MMGHGSSVFGIIPLAIVAAWRGLPSWRWLGVAVLVGIVVMAPWSAYQKWGDPPGDRLTKWTLAGGSRWRRTEHRRSDQQGLLGSRVQRHVDNKWENFKEMLGIERGLGNRPRTPSKGASKTPFRDLRVMNFFFLLPSFTLLLLAPIAMLLFCRRRDRAGPEWSVRAPNSSRRS